MADRCGHDPDDTATAERHYDARTRDVVDVGAAYRNWEDDCGIGHRRRTPSPGSVGSRIWPCEMVAPVNGSSTVRAAPSKSAASTSGVKCAAAVMPRELSIIQPTMT